MNWKDHNPPHFHARYGEMKALFDFQGSLIEGNLSPKALILVREWAALHQNDLNNNWERMQTGKHPLPIQPLE